MYLKDFLLYTLYRSVPGSESQERDLDYCSEDSIHSSRPGMGENVGAFGGS